MPHLALLLTVGHGFDALSDSVNGLLERVFGRLHEVFTVLNFFFNYYLFKNIFKLFFLPERPESIPPQSDASAPYQRGWWP